MSGVTTVLVVEDEFAIADFLEIAFTDAGYRVLTAANRRQGLERLAEGPLPDLIISDYMMPVLDGAGGRANCSAISLHHHELDARGERARTDAARGTLGQEQLERIKVTVKALVRGLARHDDGQPLNSRADDRVVGLAETEKGISRQPDPASVSDSELPETWKSPSAVLCVAGKGPLDEAASAMLAQLLGKHGMGARVVSYEEVSREEIGSLDVSGVVMVCISYLDITGSPAHLRYLIERLRQHLPSGAHVLVGVWPAGDATLTDKAAQHAIGADHYTGSLEKAVTSFAEAALRARRQDGRRSVA